LHVFKGNGNWEGPIMICGRRLSLPSIRHVTRRRLILLAVALIVAVQVISGLASSTDTTPADDATIVDPPQRRRLVHAVVRAGRHWHCERE
jgi:hypothetical protein